MNRRVPVVALTGGIASGKSTVTERLQALGAFIVDTDLIARELVEPGSPGLKALVKGFGPEILAQGGGLDRAEMRKRLFGDPEFRRQVESILHPLIEAEARQRLGDAGHAPYAVLVVPLLAETGLFPEAERIVVVDLPEAEQMRRMMERDQASEDAARRALAAQASRDQRLKIADDVIDNSGSVEELLAQAERLHQHLCRAFDRL